VLRALFIITSLSFEAAAAAAAKAEVEMLFWSRLLFSFCTFGGGGGGSLGLNGEDPIDLNEFDCFIRMLLATGPED